jgi:hypothetical protein
MADTKDGSIAARCISFARQGMIAFSYDMVGFNDTRFADSAANKPFYEVHRLFGAAKADQLWSISAMGLQTWNSIRALDFLATLPDVDRKRLACTGESGGGTQTFMLGAVEDRLAAQAPVVMVSHTMQGGCSCENAPGLRVEYSNMEFAAAAAPRPQILVAASGDWTKDTMTVEGPSIEQVYKLFRAQDKFRYVRFDFGHNYNQTSREAVYEWFGKFLLRHPESVSLKEDSCRKEPDADLRVFPGKLPADAMTMGEFTESLKKLHRRQWEASVPKGKNDLAEYKRRMQPAWQHNLQLEWPVPPGEVHAEPGRITADGVRETVVTIQRAGEQGGVAGVYRAKESVLAERAPKLAVVIGADERGTTCDGLLEKGYATLRVKEFSTSEPTNQFANFYSTYNRTKAQERVRDLLTICASAPSLDSRKKLPFKITLVGTGRAGLWTLLAAPGADAVIADCDGVASESEEQLLSNDLFCPGLLAMGGFEGAALLAAPHPLLLHNVGDNFALGRLRTGYGAAGKLKVEKARLSEEQILGWIARLD